MLANHHRDVRVTAKDWRVSESHVGSAKVFVAPEVSPVPTHLVEMAKGEQGWTDTEVSVPVVSPTVQAAMERAKARRAEALASTVGATVCRKASSDQGLVAVPTGPDAEYRAKRLRAARLAALEGTLSEW